MDIELLSKKYVVRRLDINDVDAVYDMSCKNKIFSITYLQQIQIEQNRCAMACQGCGAVFYFF